MSPVSNAEIRDLVRRESTDTPPDSFYATLPVSISDLPPPASLTIVNDRLVIDKNIRHLIDYYLSAVGEEPLSSIMLRIKHDFASQLNDDDYGRAVKILEGYLQYKNNIEKIIVNYSSFGEATSLSLQAIKAAKQEVISSRFEFMSQEVIEAFFQNEDEYDEYVLLRKEIQMDQTLSNEQKQTLLSELALQAPAWITEQNQLANSLNDFRRLEKRLKADGFDAQEIQSIRENTYGTEIADRLKKLDETRSEWNQRLSAYRHQLQQIVDNASYPADDKKAMIKELRISHFNDREVVRIKALDRITYGTDF